MERLTDKKSRNPIPDAQGGLCVTAEFVRRLAAYEDTGLSLETVSDLIERFSAFYNMVDGLDLVDPVHWGAFLDRVKHWAQAEKDGRLVVLPCKVGDTAWTNMAIVGDRYKSADRPYPVEIVFIGIGGNGGFFHVQYSNGRISPFDFDKFGKTVFLTREEAEAALKKREEADNEAD